MPDPRIEPPFGHDTPPPPLPPSSIEAPAGGSPDKRTRMALILELAAEAPAAANAEEANALLDEAFAHIESSIPRADRMGVEPLRLLQKTMHNGMTIYFEQYKSHTLYIGDNGAIDIRRGDRSIFEKPGADGGTVWGTEGAPGDAARKSAYQ